MKNEKMKKDSSIILCESKNNEEVVIKENSRYLGTLIVGPAGSGKTEGVLIPLVKQDINNKNGVVVFDKKGTLSDAAYVYAKSKRRKVYYLNPNIEELVFNPIKGEENDVINGLIFAFKLDNLDSPQFFIDMGSQLISNGIKIIKRLKGEKANLIDLSVLISNIEGRGKKMVSQFSKLETDTSEKAKENAEIASWFINCYFSESTKVYEHTEMVRSMLNRILMNDNTKRLLTEENGDELDFPNHIKNKDVVIINIDFYSFGSIGYILENLLIYSYQSAIFKQNKDKSVPNFLYIDEFQYFNPLLEELILRGRIYNVGMHLAIQHLSLLKKEARDLILANMRNLVLTPGLPLGDAEFFTKTFINKFSSSSIFQMNFGEILYNLTDNDMPGCKNTGIGDIQFPTEDDINFRNKRMRDYRNQFLRNKNQ